MNIRTKQYVSFDKNTGEIFGIGPSINESYDYIEITDEQVKPFQTLKENFINWSVKYNKRSKKFELKKNTQEEEQKFLINELTQPVDNYHDLEFVVDKNKKICYVNNLDLQHDITQLTFYITEKGDPHILLNTFDFQIDKKTEYDFAYDSYSVYTKNLFADCVVKEKQ